MSLWKGSKHQGRGPNATDRNQKLFVLMRGQFPTGHHSHRQTGQSRHVNMTPDKAPAIPEMDESGATILTTAQAGIARVHSQINGSTLKYFFPLFHYYILTLNFLQLGPASTFSISLHQYKARGKLTRQSEAGYTETKHQREAFENEWLNKTPRRVA